MGTERTPRAGAYAPSDEPLKMGRWCEINSLPYDTYRRDYLRSEAGVDDPQSGDGWGRVYYPPDHPWAGGYAWAYQARKGKPIWVYEPSLDEVREQIEQRAAEGEREISAQQEHEMARLLKQRGWLVKPPPSEWAADEDHDGAEAEDGNGAAEQSQEPVSRPG